MTKYSYKKIQVKLKQRELEVVNHIASVIKQQRAKDECTHAIQPTLSFSFCPGPSPLNGAAHTQRVTHCAPQSISVTVDGCEARSIDFVVQLITVLVFLFSKISPAAAEDTGLLQGRHAVSWFLKWCLN